MANDTARVRSFFDGFADSYAGYADAPLRKHYDWPVVETLLPDVAGKRLLDVACGPGDTAARLAQKGADVLGIDASREMIRVADERYGDSVDFRQGDLAEPLDFIDDGTVDVVLSQLTLGHLKDWTSIFEEFRRVLVPGGTVVLVLSHPFSDYLMLQDEEFPPFGGLFGEAGDPTVTGERDRPRYPEVERFEGRWDGDDDSDGVPFYRRPLEDVFRPLFETGFELNAVREPTPTAELNEAVPETFEAFRHRPPMFLCLRARKR